MDRRDMDSDKHVNEYPLQYIEHDPQGTMQTVVSRNSMYAPEALPPSGLEVMKDKYADSGEYAPEALPNSDLEVLVNPKQSTTISSKPLPPAPAYEAVIATNNVPPKKRKLTRKTIIIIAIVVVLALVAIIVGAVVGARNSGSDRNEKADPSETQDESNDQLTSVPPAIVPSPSTSSAAPEPSSSGPSVQLPDEDDVKIGSSFSASFTFYGSADGGDGVNCKTSENSCGKRAESGYAAGVSQNLYGNGMTCGTCWRLRADVDAGKELVNRTIVVLVNEICPAEGYPICGQKNLTSVNSFDAQVNFNLCGNTGASDALFGFNSGVDMAIGKATRVDCKEWKGKVKDLW